MIPPTNTTEHRRAYSRLVTCAVFLVLPVIFAASASWILLRDFVNCVGGIVGVAVGIYRWGDTSIRAGFRHPRG